MRGCDHSRKTNQRRPKTIASTHEGERSHDCGRTGQRSSILFVKLGRNPIEIIRRKRRGRNCADNVEGKRGILIFNFVLFNFLNKEQIFFHRM